MKKHPLFLSLFLSLFILNSCQKELSLEAGGTPSEGSLQSDVTGDCLPKTVGGIYEAGTALSGAANYIDVVVDVTAVGGYEVYTDTLNGMFFRATGVFTSTGLNTVRLNGSGTPVNEGVDTYIVTYNGTICTVAVTTLPAGGAGPAEFTLVSGAGGDCSAFNLSGTYTASLLLNPSNTVELNINVTTIGTYDITTTPSNGIAFSGTGVLTAPGATTIILTASGKPVVGGTTNIIVTAGASTCNFNVEVVEVADYTFDCGTALVNGVYEEGVALDGTNTISIQVNVTVAGGYNITGTVNGMTFLDEGEFTTTGNQSITLQGSGTPGAAGDFDVPVSGVSPICNVGVTVEAGSSTDAGDWKFNQGATVFQGSITAAELEVTSIPAPPVTLTTLIAEGTNAASDFFTFGLIDAAGGIQTGETYVSSNIPPAGNSCAFQYVGASADYAADFTTTGKVMTFIVTSHNTGTKTIEGTYSGTAENGNGDPVPITSGTFKATYP